jgi:hypothetical protein
MESTGVTIKKSGSRWHASPITTYTGQLHQVRQFIPRFDRRTFGPALLPVKERDTPSLFTDRAQLAGVNHFYDVIVRRPLTTEVVEIPVGIVSRQYSLIQHQELVDETIRAVQKLRIDPAEMFAEMDLTEYGERMRLGLLFPKRYNLKINGKDEMGLRLECFNSVDGSTKFMAVVGWLRFVCANGLIVGVVNTDFRHRHNKTMKVQEIAAILQEGIAATTREREVYRVWMGWKVSDDSLMNWVNGPLAKQWGVKAAVRTWSITRNGYDVSLAKPFEKGVPTEKTVVQGKKIPGAVVPGNTVYAIAQSLAWLAKERRDVQERLEWKQQIGELVRPLLEEK